MSRYHQQVKVGDTFKSNIHDAVVIVTKVFGGTTSYIVKDQGRTVLGNGTEYYIANSVFKEWYVDNGVVV